MKSAIDVYCNQDVIDHYGLTGHRIHAIQPFRQFQLGSFVAKGLPVPHDEDAPNLAFLLQSEKEKCLFIIDALYCPYYFSGLTHIFLGINYDSDILKQNIKNGSLDPTLGRRIMQTHMSLKTGLQFFKDQDLSKVEEIHILHCSESNLDKEKTKREIQKLTGKLVIIWK